MKSAIVMTFMISMFLLSNRKIATSRSIQVSHQIQYFENITYRGSWCNLEDNSDTGLFYLEIHLERGETNKYKIEMRYYHGQWHDDTEYYLKSSVFPLESKASEISLNETTLYIQINGIWVEHKGAIEIFLPESGKEISGSVCTPTRRPCFQFSASAFPRDQQLSPKLYYLFIVSLCYLLTITVVVKHFQHCLDNSTFAEKSSLLTLGLMEVCELGLALWGLHSAFRNSSGFDYIFMASFWSFATFSFLHSRLIPTVFRSQNSSLTPNGVHIRSRIVANFQTRFFLLCLILIIMVNALQEFKEVTLPLLHLVFVPQIITNSVNGYKDSFSLSGAAGYVLSKSVIVLYLFGCPANFMRYKPNLRLGLGIVLVLLLQLAVLQWQRYRPRFLVPKRYRPMSYDYFRTKGEEVSLASDADISCIICMTPLNLGVTTNEPLVNHAKTMHTPCSHRFHQDCLTQWMAIKMECPTCRARLPVVDDSL